MGAHGWTWVTCTFEIFWNLFFELNAQRVQVKVKFLITFNMFNISFGYVFLSQPCSFLFHFCNNILLNSCFTLVVFLFFSFHDLDLGLSLPLFSFWFGKSCKVGCFHAYDMRGLHIIKIIYFVISCRCWKDFISEIKTMNIHDMNWKGNHRLITIERLSNNNW